MSPLPTRSSDSARLEYVDEQQAHHHSCKTSDSAAALAVPVPSTTSILPLDRNWGERTFPGKQSSLTHRGGSPPPSEGGSEGLLMAQERGFQFRQESCNKFWRRIASFRHPLRHRPLRSPFLRSGNIGNASALKRSSTKRRCSGFLSFFLSILSSLLQRQRASAFLPSDASVTTCTYCCSCGRGWVGGPSGESAASRCSFLYDAVHEWRNLSRGSWTRALVMVSDQRGR